MSARLRGSGLAITLPPGWDGQIRGNAATAQGSGAVVHAGSFPLPASRGDFGSGAVERMGSGDVLVCLLEYTREDARTELFRHDGVPTLTASAFSPQAMQRPIAGMAGAQHFFRSRGRAFCLYVVLGSWRGRVPLARAAADVVSTITVD